jgi:hypothetical protein
LSAHVDPVELSGSSGPERREMLAHVAVCAACRSAVAADDPSQLFGLLALTPIPERVLDELSSDVARLAGRDRSPYGALAGALAGPRRVAAAAALALALLCGYETLREQPAAPETASVSQPRADVDVDSGRGVSQVIDLTVGETQIVMVYNGDLKL